MLFLLRQRYGFVQLVRDKLEDVGPDKRMVESLVPMWDEERQRCGGTGPPSPPPDPKRDPQPLCPTVDFIRAQFQVYLYPWASLCHACSTACCCAVRVMSGDSDLS